MCCTRLSWILLPLLGACAFDSGGADDVDTTGSGADSLATSSDSTSTASASSSEMRDSSGGDTSNDGVSTSEAAPTASSGDAESSTGAEPQPALEVAEELIVSLDARSDSAGAELWINEGSGSDFALEGSVARVEIDGHPGVQFSTDSIYRSLEPAPDTLVGSDPTRSIEVWVWNETIEAEETLVAWSRRGGPTGSNMAFNYGTHELFGAVGHWGSSDPDLGWSMVPAAQTWHHLVYTFDGAITRVYADGRLDNSEDLGVGALDTVDGFPIALGAQNLDGGGSEIHATLVIARVRVHAGVLSEEQIAYNFELEASDFGVRSSL